MYSPMDPGSRPNHPPVAQLLARLPYLAVGQRQHGRLSANNIPIFPSHFLNISLVLLRREVLLFR